MKHRDRKPVKIRVLGYVEPSLRTALEARADAQGVPMNTIIADALRRYLAA